MVALNFDLSPDSCAKLFDLLSCLAKFNETVSLEAQKESITLSTLNSTKSAYGSFTLHKPFFVKYSFNPGPNASDGRFTCAILNKALLSVFKRSVIDPRNRDTALDRCNVRVQEHEDQAECRLIIQMICYGGVTKTYKLTYESVEVMHALFDKSSASNKWTIKAGFMREFTDYFSPKAEQLDMYCEEGKMTFLSFTEKVVNAKSEVLKQPLKTAVSVQQVDFEHFDAQDKLHLIMSVKDFKNIIAHADTLQTSVSAIYSVPGRPLQFNYGAEGLQCQFTLMTAGDCHGTPAATASAKAATREPSRSEPRVANGRGPIEKLFSAEMPPPAVPKTRKLGKNLGQNESMTTSTISNPSDRESEGLFVTQEDDSQWDPPNYEDGEESLGWNATADNDSAPYPTLRDTSTTRTVSHQTLTNEEGLVPTQKLSQIRGLW